MPLHQSLLSTLSPAGEPLLQPAPPAADQLIREQLPEQQLEASPAAGVPALMPAQHRLLLSRCHTAVTLQERRPSSTAGRLLRSLTPSRGSLAPSVSTAAVSGAGAGSSGAGAGLAQLRHAATLSSLEQARITGSATCSRCGVAHSRRLPLERRVSCGVCLQLVSVRDLHRAQLCGCAFCKECMSTYIRVCVENGDSRIRCPDPDCRRDGHLNSDEILKLTDVATHQKYMRINYIHAVERDVSVVWCPRPDCDTACSLPAAPGASDAGSAARQQGTSGQGGPSPGVFQCPTCGGVWCAVCRQPRNNRPENGEPHQCRPERWTLGGSLLELGNTVKQCPRCGIGIERDEGCAQMMCRRCRHVFCWYCLTSLDGDLFLRHYDRGPCRYLLGHSRGSLILHRVQLVGALMAIGLGLIVAAPALILFAPVFICTSCPCEMSGSNSTARRRRESAAAPAADEASDQSAPLAAADLTRVGADVTDAPPAADQAARSAASPDQSAPSVAADLTRVGADVTDAPPAADQSARSAASPDQSALSAASPD